MVSILALPPHPSTAALDQGRLACDYCKMIITRADFGGEILTTGGARLIFDSTECLAAYVLSRATLPQEIRTMVSIDHEAPRHRLRAEQACYLHSASLESPMAMNLSAYRSRARAEIARRRHPGGLLTWPQVLALVDSTWHPVRTR